MGCISSTPETFESNTDGPVIMGPQGLEKRTNKFDKPIWAWDTQADGPIDPQRLERMRAEFWDTQPHYGGDRVIWDALKVACESDIETARTIVEAAGIIVTAPDMSICYDERGARYELPRYVLSNPSNLHV